ncbi:hypothetical protein C0J52_04977 [Blattella germanica]|nr:hypothetical protein C0J52_04977 [Blattella germanica]
MEMSVPSESGLIATIMPEVCYPNVNATSGLAPSPVNEFLADEEAASTCPLLTPSPPAEFEHPLSTTGMAYERQISPTSIDELTGIPALNGTATLGFVNDMPVSEHNGSRDSQEVQQEFKPTNSVHSVMESSSSSSSVTQEPTVCAQLLSSHHYQHLTKASDVDSFACQENGGKPPLTGIQLAVRKSPDDFCFMDWNWPLIRKFSIWGCVSLMVACVCIVITLIAGLPSKCNPEHTWWQGTVVRLNSIFYAEHYPENFEQVQNLTEIAPALGSMRDFNIALAKLHERNISVVLDLPLGPFIKQISKSASESLPDSEEAQKTNWMAVYDLTMENASDVRMEADQMANRVKRKESESKNLVSAAISYWLQNGVDGIYLKGLEYLVDDPNFAPLVREWKRVTKSFSKDWDHEKILMCSLDVVNALDLEDDARKVNTVLSNMDLIDVKLDVMNNGTVGLKKQIDKVIKMLSEKPSYPWIHWHLGSIDSKRLTSQLPTANASLAALMFELMLPGSPSIFYGDEIGLEDFKDPEGEVMTVGNDIVIVERSYPRRHSFVIVSNFGTHTQTKDLSFLYYGGEVMADQRGRVGHYLTFHALTLYAGESIIIKLDK